MYVSSFKELEVYKLSRKVSQKIFNLTNEFPFEERFSLTNQIRRSSRSIGAQIAESWGKRRYISHFILKLTDSDSEQFETQHWVEIAFENKYISQDDRDLLIADLESIGKMLNSMIDKANLFCQKK